MWIECPNCGVTAYPRNVDVLEITRVGYRYKCRICGHEWEE